MTDEFQPDHPPICNYEDSDYQKEFWDKGGREYEDQVEAVALKRLLPPSGKLILDAGAGAGRNTPRYQGFEKVVLLDFSMSQLRLAQERLGGNSRHLYVAANIYKLPFVHGVFDTVTMIRTIHHMADAKLALRQVRNVLQTDGIFILEFASKHNLKAIARYLTGRQSWSPFTLDPVEFVELNFDFHPHAILDWLHETDFVVERQLTVSHYRINFLKRLIPTRLLVWMDSLTQLSGDWWQLTPSVFVRARAVGETPKAQEGVLFCCPECGHTPLEEDENLLKCTSCSRQWKIDQGIYDFRSPV